MIHTIRNFKEKIRYKNILLMFLNDYFYSCVCMYLYMCTYLQVSVHVCIVCVVYMHMCTCECGHWRMMLGIFNHSPPYILRQGLSLDLDLSNFTGLSLTSESPPSSQHRDRRVTPPCCFFLDVGSKLRSLMPAWRTLSQLSHFPRFRHSCLQGRWL